MSVRILESIRAEPSDRGLGEPAQTGMKKGCSWIAGGKIREGRLIPVPAE